MYRIIFRVFFFISAMLVTVFAHGQDSSAAEKPQMADMMRSNGKIYVVVAVLVIILLGLFIYLLTLDRKINRLENNNK